MSATEFKEKFQRFIEEFKEDVVEEDDFQTVDEIASDKPFYMRKLEEVIILVNSLEHDWVNILS